MSDLTGSSRLVPACEFEDFGDEIVVYVVERAGLHHLNRSAAEVFRLLDGQRSMDEMLVFLADRTGVAVENLAADVEQVLRGFLESGIVVDSP